MWWLLLLPFSAFAQNDIDLSALDRLEEKLPSYELDYGSIDRRERRYLPPDRVIDLEDIKESDVFMGSARAGVPLIRIKDNKVFRLTKAIYFRYYGQEDENGHKYLLNKDGSSTFKMISRHVEPIKEELVLYEPPKHYTPAPQNIVHAEYDHNLTLLPEVTFYTGIIMGDYMRDLFNDTEAGKGTTTQYGAHLFTEWKLPVKVGAVVNYEKSTYHLSGAGSILYSSLSFGPQFKTRDLKMFDWPLRAQMQFRISPFARATAEMAQGTADFKFNSADLLASLERPFKNGWGQFVLGAFIQLQWLSIREQEEVVSVSASNKSNKTFGISLSQVFD